LYSLRCSGVDGLDGAIAQRATAVVAFVTRNLLRGNAKAVGGERMNLLGCDAY
jgi:hypothetical protein